MSSTSTVPSQDQSEVSISLSRSEETVGYTKKPRYSNTTYRPVRKKKEKKHRVLSFITGILKSDPEEFYILKSVVGFPMGVAIGYIFYLVAFQPMDFDVETNQFIGGIMCALMALGFSLSTQVRCIVCLFIPTFFGRAGRTYITAFAIIFLISGPITNIVDNCREVTRAISCLVAYKANLTQERWKFRATPLEEAVRELQEDGFMLGTITENVEKEFFPLKKEIESDEDTKTMEQELQEVERIVSKSESREIAALKRKPNEGIIPMSDKQKGLMMENKWKKKLNRNCENIYVKAILRCKNYFLSLEKDCMDKLWVVGYLLCWPLKITFFCEIARLLMKAFGLNCDAVSVVDPGSGESYVAADRVIDDMSNGMKIEMQYKVVAPNVDLNYMTAEEIRVGTMRDFETKAKWVDNILLLFKRGISFTFLYILYVAFQYHKRYLAVMQFDNIYITSYFRKIDARRHAAGKVKLLPLKKTEKKKLIFPTSLKLMAVEKKNLSSGSGLLFIRVIVTGIIIYVDYVIVYVLTVISVNSKVVYQQKGFNYINITVNGIGFMSQLVRMFLGSFNKRAELNSTTSNVHCLPRPITLDPRTNYVIFLIYFAVWASIFIESYGLRLRRVICSFFYRKREKTRVLYLYNQMLKKRKIFITHMRKKILKQVREKTLERQTDLLIALRLQCPKLCFFLKFISKDKCIICEEAEGKGFVRCPTDGCNCSYCNDCWLDIKKKCLACKRRHKDSDSDTDFSSSSSESSPLSDEDHYFQD